MSKTTQRYAGIAGLGYAVPEKVLTNADLEKMVDTSDEWIKSRTGICERRIAGKNQGTSVLAAQAAQKALKQAGLAAKDLDLIIVGTTTPDVPLPSCACLVQERIGATKAACFDLGAACAGFVYSLATADQFIRSGMYQNVLVIGADQISSYIDWKDRSTCILFGDGAGACVLKAQDQPGILDHNLGSDGQHQELITIKAGGSRAPATDETVKAGAHFLKMSGAEVFKLAVRGMLGSIEAILAKTHLDASQIACIIPHQANMRIIDAVSQRLSVDKKKIFVNLDRYGNTSAASNIIALSEAVEQGCIKSGDYVLLTTFGSGLVWGATIIKWA